MLVAPTSLSHAFCIRILLAWIVASAAAAAQVDPTGRSILFVRGADGTGGLGNGSTEHLSDIRNTSTSSGNHGFGELAQTLRADGFTVTQWIESDGPLTLARLQPHRAVVFGSNNRVYAAGEVAAFHAYVDAGGSALFMSDANWGPNWDAASASDNQFLARYGLQVYQDSGFRPVLQRSDPGRYVELDHPVLSGPDGIGAADDVGAFEGEGVSFFDVRGTPPSGWTTKRLVDATGFRARLTTGNGSRGATRPTLATDAALVAVTRGASTVLGHFDRNTFFNVGGVGSNITRFDNRQLALNLARMLASVPARTAPVGAACAGGGRRPTLTVDPPIIGRDATWRLRAAAPRAATAVLLAPGAAAPTTLPGGCVLEPALADLAAAAGPSTDGNGDVDVAIPVPNDLAFSGVALTTQVVVLGLPAGTGPVFDTGELSPGVELTIGYPR